MNERYRKLVSYLEANATKVLSESRTGSEIQLSCHQNAMDTTKEIDSAEYCEAFVATASLEFEIFVK